MNGIFKLIGAAALAAAVALTASCSNSVAAPASAGKTDGARTIALNVEGMTCASCSVAVRHHG